MTVTTQMIHPELRAIGTFWRFVIRGPKTEQQLRSKDSAFLSMLARITPRGLDVREEIAVAADGTAVTLHVCTRTGSTGTNRPGILWIHGGGYSGGTARGELTTIKEILDQVDAVVVSPDYRRSKEAPYPAALNDCYAPLLWLKEHAERLGVRSDQIIVAGGSAGGGLTAATTLLARDRGEVNVAFQMPLYPMIDDRGTPSSTGNDAPVYDGATNEANWRIYLGDLYGTADVPATAAPARADNYAQLPPTITFVGGVDPFRDETVAYATNLRKAGVPVAIREIPGAWHGFDLLAPWTKVAKQAKAWRNEELRRYLNTYTAPQS